MTDRDLADLSDELRALYFQWKSLCNAKNIPVAAIVTWRSAADQNTAQTNHLSNARAGQSPHNCCTPDGEPASKAFDFGVFDCGIYIKDGTDPRYKQAGEIGKSLGLVWGGDWTKEKDGCDPDWDHLEWPNWRNS